MQYTDLHVKFSPLLEDGSFVVTMHSRFTKNAETRFQPPFAIEDFEGALPDLRCRKLPRDSPFHPNHLGPTLFEALFHGKTLKCYERALKRARGQVRIKLHTMASSAGHELLNRIPWELMQHSRDPDPLIVMPQTTLVRYLPCGVGGPGVIPFPPKLRVLVVVPRPKNSKQPLNPEDTLHSFHKVLGEENVTLLQEPTLEGLKHALAEQKYHILHFTTHGVFHRGKGLIELEDSDGKSHKVKDEDLARMVRSAGGKLRLVTLFSCQTGRMGSHADGANFTGVAPALIQRGVPAVLAMQFNFTIAAAHVFMEEFYWALSKGKPVDTAAGWARTQLIVKELRKLDWCTPVLFMSTENGRLFSKTQRIHVNTVLAFANAEDGEEFVDLSQCFHGKGLKGFHLSGRLRWNTDILPKLKALKGFVVPDRPITFSGKSRLPVWLALGYLFAETAGVTLKVEQLNAAANGGPKRQVWSSNARPEEISFEMQTQKGNPAFRDMVVNLSITKHIEADVGRYLEKHPALKWREWRQIHVLPEPGRDGLKRAGQAVSLAREIGRQISARAQQEGVRTVHLFLSCPAAFALFMGMQLNACRTLQVYEWDRQQYFRTFRLK